jgi:hypothetical protein
VNKHKLHTCIKAGLPDGIFEDQRSQFWYILEDPGRKNVGILMAICYILRPLVFLMAILAYFVVFPFQYVVPRKIGQP